MTPREKWLKRRRELLTASDVAAVLGYDEYKGPLAVWANKVHGIEEESTRAMRNGSYMEKFISDEYADERQVGLVDPGDYEIAVHPDIPWLGATLDRECSMVVAPAYGFGATELKAISPRTCTAKQWVECPPQKYIIQNQIQMACAGMLWGTLVAWIGGADLVWYDHLRDDDFLPAIMPHLEEFWGYVQRKEPPPDTSPGINIVAKSIWTETNGGTIEMFDYLEKADLWEYSAEQRRYWNKQEPLQQGQIRIAMENNSFGLLGDGSYLKRKANKNGQIRLRRVRPGEMR